MQVTRLVDDWQEYNLHGTLSAAQEMHFKAQGWHEFCDLTTSPEFGNNTHVLFVDGTLVQELGDVLAWLRGL